MTWADLDFELYKEDFEDWLLEGADEHTPFRHAWCVYDAIHDMAEECAIVDKE